MPSTYTLNNGIELIGTGEQSGTWGDTTNTNMELLDTALDGQVSIALTSAGSSGSPNSLPISDGANSNGRNRLIVFTGTPGAADATVYVQLTPNDAEKIIYVRNDLGGTRVIRLFQGTYSASNDYDVPQGTTAVVFFDGAGTGAVAANVFNNAFFDSLRLGGVSVTAILDEDDMSSDSATALATQQSIKKYVDDKAAAQDTLAEVLANGNTTGGTDILFGDNDKALFGAGSDLQIYHSGTNSVIDNNTGHIYIRNNVDNDDGSNIYIQGKSGENSIVINDDSNVELYFDNALKLATTTTGVDITGTAVTDGVTVDGNLSVDGGTIKLDGNYPVGTNNVALGDAALSSAASGSSANVAIGENSLASLTSGVRNTGVGRYSLNALTSGTDNVSVGAVSLQFNTGNYNTGLGSQALASNNTASNNTMAGYQAGYLVGEEIVATAIVSGVNYTIQTLGTTDFTLIGASSNTVGTTFTATGAGSGTGTASANANYNTFVGHQSGDVIVGGSKNTILGRFDGNQNTIDIRNSDNNIVLSDGDGNPRLAYVSANTELVINEQSADVDFRVESDSNTHALFVDAGSNAVHIGGNTDVDDSPLVVHANTNANAIAIRGRSDDISEISFFENDATTKLGTLQFRNTYARLDHRASGGSVNINVGPSLAQIADFYETGPVFNESGSSSIDFRVESDSNANMLFVDAGANYINVGGSVRQDNALLQITGAKSYSSSYVIRNQIIASDTTALSAGVTGGAIGFNGVYNTGGSTTQFGSVEGLKYNGNSGDYGGEVLIRSRRNGGNNEERASFSAAEAVFNEDSHNTDFRVESDSNANMLLVDASADTVHIGSNTGPAVLNVSSTGRGSSVIGLNVVNTDSGSGVNTLFNLTNNYDQDLQFKVSEVGAATKTVYIGPSTNTSLVITGAGVGTLNRDLYLDSASLVVNQDSRDYDFRVESDGNAHMLFVDAGNNRVGIGKSSLNYTLDVEGSIASAHYLRVDSNSGVDGSALLTLKRDGNTAGDYLQMRDGSNNLFAGFDEGGIILNEVGADTDFRVESDANAHMLFVDAGNNSVCIGTSAPRNLSGLTVASNQSSTMAVFRTDVNGGSASGTTGLHMGDAGSGVVVLARDKTSVNTADTVIYGEHGYNVQDERIRASRGYINLRADGATRVQINSVGITSTTIYNNTSGGGANLGVASSGEFFRSTSSLKYKTEVQDAEHGLSEVLSLRPVTYKGLNDGDKVFGGLIAEEVHDAGLSEFVEYDESGEPDALSYANMVSLCVKAIQEQHAVIETLEARITALENA